VTGERTQRAERTSVTFGTDGVCSWMPRGLVGLLAGESRGKRMIRVAPDPA
jgi:hypothetical protein